MRAIKRLSVVCLRRGQSRSSAGHRSATKSTPVRQSVPTAGGRGQGAEAECHWQKLLLQPILFSDELAQSGLFTNKQNVLKFPCVCMETTTFFFLIYSIAKLTLMYELDVFLLECNVVL